MQCCLSHGSVLWGFQWHSDLYWTIKPLGGKHPCSCSADGNGKHHCVRGTWRFRAVKGLPRWGLPSTDEKSSRGQLEEREPGSSAPKLGSVCFSLPPFLNLLDKSCLCRGRRAQTYMSRHTCTSSNTVFANLWLPKRDNSVIPARGFAGELTDGRSPLPIWREHRFNQLTLPFSTWHRLWEMYLDLRPPSSPHRLLTSLFFCDLTAAIAAKHFATCHRDKPVPSLSVANCFASQALPDGQEHGEARFVPQPPGIATESWGQKRRAKRAGWVLRPLAFYVGCLVLFHTSLLSSKH